MKNGKHLVIRIGRVSYRSWESEEGDFHVWESDDGHTGFPVQRIGSHFGFPAPVDIDQAYQSAQLMLKKNGGWKEEIEKDRDILDRDTVTSDEKPT